MVYHMSMSRTAPTNHLRQARSATAWLLASVLAATGADADDRLVAAAPPSDPPALFLNLAPATGVGALSHESHAAILAGAGVGLRVGEASGEASMHLGTGGYARHYSAELQGRYFSTPTTYLIGLLQYGWVSPDEGSRAYANATAFAGFGAMLAGSRHLYAELAVGTGNAWLTDAAGANQVQQARYAMVSGYGMINYDRGLCSAATILRRGSD